jgi:Fe-S-cluster containining protein
MIARLTMADILDDLPLCAGCGSCCHLVVELLAGVDDVPEEFVVVNEGARCMDQRGDGACVALDPASRLCTIYERRPQTCRDFSRGTSLCRKAVGRFLGGNAVESGAAS